MEKAGQKFLYLRKLSPTNFDSESNSNFLTGKSRPKILISSQTSPNRILFGIKLKNSDERGRPQIPISPQTNSLRKFHSEIFNLIPNRISLGEVCEDIRLSGLLFPFKKFEFDSKSNSVEESLLRYKNFWPVFFYSESFNLILNRISLERVCGDIGISGLPLSFRNFQFDSK